MTIVYCTKCGGQNLQGARFCNNCGAPLEVKAPAPPGVTAPPYQPPYAPRQPRQTCEERPRQEEECMGQSRLPGLVVLAIIILMVGIFGVIQWLVQEAYGSTYSGVVWPIFGIALALILIGIWALARPRAR